MNVEKAMLLLLLILITLTTINIAAANENMTDNLIQIPEETPLGANEEADFITNDVDIEKGNTPIIRINTTSTTNEIIIESNAMREEDSKVTFNTNYEPQTLELTLKDLNINYLDDYWIFIKGKGIIVNGVPYNENGEWNIGYDQLKVTADKKFSIGKYSITLSDSQYNNLRNIKEIEKNANLNNYKAGDYYGDYTVWRTYDMDTDSYKKSLTYSVTKYTGKTVKQKIGIGYKWKTIKTYSSKKAANKAMYKLQKKNHYIYTVKKIKKNGKTRFQVSQRVFKKIVTKNAKVYISIDYGGFNSDLHKFTMRVHTKYQNASETLVSGAVKGYKVSNSFIKLKS